MKDDKSIDNFKSDLRELRKELLAVDNSDLAHALNHSLQYIQNPSSESLKWLKYYLSNHINHEQKN